MRLSLGLLFITSLCGLSLDTQLRLPSEKLVLRTGSSLFFIFLLVYIGEH